MVNDKKNKKLNKKGGKAIDMGGYGCVFRPELKCRRSNNQSKKDKKKQEFVSKLMLNKDAEEEWIELKKVNKIVSKIYNYNKYFLLKNFTICKPNFLTNNDFKNIKVCKYFFQNSDNLTKDYINSNINKYSIITMPYGGENLNNIIIDKRVDIDFLNKLLISLLLNAIIPMNNLNLFHSDIKANNVLFKNNNIKLIDWGLATFITNKEKELLEIPISNKNLRLQFNCPFSRILFNKFFEDKLNKFLLENPNLNQNSKDIKIILYKFMMNYYKQWKQATKSLGHEEFYTKVIIPILWNFFFTNPPTPETASILISNYCSEILIKYIDFNTKKFKANEYFYEVYLKNIDIWGFISIYIPFLESKLYNSSQKKIISLILFKYCYSTNYANIPININDLVEDLKNIK